jgi:acyl-CoA synthetase (AMP-forming)/AMP-acid ligase II
MVFGDYRFRYGDLLRSVDATARALLANGVVRGDRVAVLCTSRPEFFVLYLAAARIGAVFVGLNPRHTRAELEFVVSDATPKILFGLTRFEGRDYRGDLDCLARECSSIAKVSRIDADGCELDGLLCDTGSIDDNRFTAALAAVVPADPLAVIYTSGSTGLRKGVVLAHGSFCAVYREAAVVWQADPVRQINNYPIDHIGGLGDVATCNLVCGGTQVFMERFDPESILKTIERERITVLGQEVAMFQRIAAEPEFRRTDFSSLQLVWWAGAAAPQTLIAALLETGARLSTCWGMSETCGPVTFVPPTREATALADSIGAPAPGVEVRIAGGTGELQLRGICVMHGYLGRDEATREAFTDDGWLRSGDRAERLADGCLRLVGRLGDMYKSGGYNISPREIERVIEAHPDVAQVAVVRTPDPTWQEVGHAFVVPRRDGGVEVAAIEQWCRERLANYKIPKKFWPVAALPMLAVGKVDRKALEARAAEWATRHGSGAPK